MLPRSIRNGETLGSLRGDVVVVFDGGGRPEQWLPSLTSVMRHTPVRVRVLVHGWGVDPEAAAPDALAPLLGDEHAERLVRLVAEREGEPAGLAEAAAVAAPADLAVVGLGCVVAADWLPRLRIAAGDDAAVATASAIPAGLIGVPAGAVDRDAAAVAEAAGRRRPRLAEPLAGAIYIRRSAIELAGPPGPGEFAEHCSEIGLTHLLADDVVVAAPARGGSTSSRAADQVLGGAVARSLAAARRSLDGLSVAFDARALAGPFNGTRVHVLELLAAVAETGRVRVTALVPPALHPATRARLEQLSGVRLATIPHNGGAPPALAADVVHRPHQVSTPADLAVLASLGRRLIVTQQDLISFHTSSYFASNAGWHGYRELTRRALAAADRVVFYSRDVHDAALGEELVEPSRASVIPIGVDHARSPAAEPVAPALAGRALDPDEPVILCLGTDLLHKNRPFALRVLAELQRSHGFTGRLVLAGPRAMHGSSRERERAILARDQDLANAVLDLGEVGEGEKEWLLRRARLVIYPTVSEGFGLIPYEAAARDVPCLWAPGSALAELLPDGAAGIVPWDPTASARAAAGLLRDDRARRRNVRVVREAGATLTWRAAAVALVELYEQASEGAAAPAGAAERAGGLMRGGVSEDAMRLVGPDGALPRDAERPLLALLGRPKLSGPLLDAMRAGYRVSHRARPRTGPPALPPGG